MGKKSAESRGYLSRRAQPIYDQYLQNATGKPDDGKKTSISKRAHRMLRRDWERFKQAKAGDQLADQRFSEDAPSGLRELLVDGWIPPGRWQTLYKRQNAAKKQ